MSTSVADRPHRLTTGPLVAVMLLGSALVHATVVEEHLSEWAVAGLFFLALVVGETLLAVVALRSWSRSLALAVAASSLATVAVWAVSRTTGMPLGPPDFRVPEQVGVPDLACCVLELAAVAFSLRTLSRRASRTRPSYGVARVLSALVLVGAVAVTGWGMHPALSGGAQHAHHHGAA